MTAREYDPRLKARGAGLPSLPTHTFGLWQGQDLEIQEAALLGGREPRVGAERAGKLWSSWEGPVPAPCPSQNLLGAMGSQETFWGILKKKDLPGGPRLQVEVAFWRVVVASVWNILLSSPRWFSPVPRDSRQKFPLQSLACTPV